MIMKRTKMVKESLLIGSRYLVITEFQSTEDSGTDTKTEMSLPFLLIGIRLKVKARQIHQSIKHFGELKEQIGSGRRAS